WTRHVPDAHGARANGPRAIPQHRLVTGQSTWTRGNDVAKLRERGTVSIVQSRGVQPWLSRTEIRTVDRWSDRYSRCDECGSAGISRVEGSIVGTPGGD